MDIEHLNKFQLVLLALLVSFVTSIATGIVTVTLLAQAPPPVTETINRVVERTIQTIVPQAASSTKQTTTQTIIVKEDDLITGSIASALSKTGRVFSGISTSTPVVALAAEIAPGVLVTDSSVVTPETHLVSLNGTETLFSVSQAFSSIGIAILVPAATSTTLDSSFKVGDTGAVKLGQTVTAILSVSNARVAIGSVSATFQLASVTKENASPVSVRAIDTNLDASSIPGAPLVNIFGDLIGISTGASQAAGGRGTFVSAGDILAVLAAKATTTPAR